MSETRHYAALSAESSYKRARILFDTGNPSSVFVPAVDPVLETAALNRRRRRQTPAAAADKSQAAKDALVVADPAAASSTAPTASMHSTSRALARLTTEKKEPENRILVTTDDKKESGLNIPTPTWHAPWKLSTVLSSHLGWVRALAFDRVNNTLFASGSADRTIKLWNLAAASVGSEQALQLTLTGHVSTVRALEFSQRHPYLFSAGEDKQVKCWDLETNQVVRHYHGHLSGVFCLALHPTLDIMVTGGRDAVARVWDIRTKTQLHCLSGHENTVGAVLVKSTFPHVVTGSYDTTIKMWDLVAGKCFTTLTHHSKSVRALVQPSYEHSFVSGAADCLKKWQGKDGRLLQTWHPMSQDNNNSRHKNVVVNAMAMNDDGVTVSGGDDGSMQFWDYATGYNFQTAQCQVQPGSLDAENAVMACAFDGTGTRLVTGQADKTIQIYKPDEDASEMTHPMDMAAWRKKCIAQAKQRY